MGMYPDDEHLWKIIFGKYLVRAKGMRVTK
jgi:hypothetical protein